MLQHSSWHENSVGLELIKASSIIGVNVFVLLTGYFSTTPKKTSLANIFFICLFWMMIKIGCDFFFNHEFDIRNLFFVTRSNWFIPSYIGLLFIAPVLNNFISTTSKHGVLGGVISLLCVEIWFDWLPPHPDMEIGTHYGYSVFSFIVLYLIGRSIKVFGVPHWFEKKSFSLYVMCTLILFSSSILSYRFLSIDITNSVLKYLFAYTNPLIILSSISFFVGFKKLKLGYSNIINHIAKSTLAVLLGHTAIFSLYIRQFRYLYDYYFGLQVVVYWAVAIMVVFCASIAIDQIRLLLYKPIEKLMKRKIKNNEIIPIENKS